MLKGEKMFTSIHKIIFKMVRNVLIKITHLKKG